MQPVVQIVPRMSGDGVGDHAFALGRALAEQGLALRYVAAQGGGHATPGDPSGPVLQLLRRDPACLADLLERASTSVVVAHYVGYGYARRGCPLWLVRGLEQWRRGRDRRLITIFHEVFACGPPWTSSFWLSPVQRRLAQRLARSSDGLVTSLHRYAGFLRRLAGRAVDLVLPVVSTIGEPGQVPPLAERAPRLVVFGSPHHRRHVYVDLRPWLETACRRLEIEEIIDIGETLDAAPPTVGGRPVRRLGKLSPGAVQEALLSSRACFVGYPPDFLPKSTVYAAACAHGLIPVCEPRQAAPQEGLVEGRHYWAPHDRPFSPAQGEVLAQTARAWYRGHDTLAQAEALQRLFHSGHPGEGLACGC